MADAAALRGWTPTNLLRVAALQRAAQILNTSRPTKLNLSRPVHAVAEAICGPRTFWKREKYEPDASPIEVHPEEIFGDDWEFWSEPLPFSEDGMQSLRQAVSKGGPDFLALVLAECARLSKPADPAQDLLDPIDPDSFS